MQPRLFIHGSPKSALHLEHFKEVGGGWKLMVEEIGFKDPNLLKENQLGPAMLRKSKTIRRSTLANTPCKTNPNNTTQTTQTSQTNPRNFREGEGLWLWLVGQLGHRSVAFPFMCLVCAILVLLGFVIILTLPNNILQHTTLATTLTPYRNNLR